MQLQTDLVATTSAPPASNIRLKPSTRDSAVIKTTLQLLNAPVIAPLDD